MQSFRTDGRSLLDYRPCTVEVMVDIWNLIDGHHQKIMQRSISVYDDRDCSILFYSSLLCFISLGFFLGGCSPFCIRIVPC